MVFVRSLLLTAALACSQWNVAWGQVGEVLAERPHLLSFGNLHSAKLSADRSYLATAGSAGAVLWEVDTGEPLEFLALPEVGSVRFPGFAIGLAFEEDGSAVYGLYGPDRCGPEIRLVVRWSLSSGEVLWWPGLSGAIAAFPRLPELLDQLPCHVGWGWQGNRYLMLSRAADDEVSESPAPLHVVLSEAGYGPGELRAPRRVNGSIVALEGRDLLFLDRDGHVTRRVLHAALDDDAGFTVLAEIGQLLLWDESGLKLFDLASGRLQVRIPDRRRVASSRDGRLLVAGGEDGVELRSLPSGKLVRVLEASMSLPSEYEAYRFSPSERHLTLEREGRLTIWSTETGERVATLELLPGDWLWSVTFDAGETRAVVLVAPASLAWLYDFDGLVSAYRPVVLDLETGERSPEFSGHVAYPEDLAFTREGELVVLSDARHVRIFDLDGEIPRLEAETRTSDDATRFAERQLVADGRLVLRSRGGVDLVLYPLAPEAPVWESHGELTLQLPYDRLSEESQAALKGLVERLADLTRDSRSIPIYEYLPVEFASWPGGWGRGAAIGRNGDWLAAVAGKDVRLLNFRPVTSEELSRPDRLEVPRPIPADPKWGREWPIRGPDAVLFAEQRDLLVAYTELIPPFCYECYEFDYPTGLWLWDVQTSDLLVQAEMPFTGTPVALSFSRLAAATGMWDVGTGERLCEWPEATAVALGPYVAIGDSQGMVQLRDVRTCAYLAPLPGHGDRIEELLFSRDGQWLASRSRDGTVRVWPIVGDGWR